MRKLCFRLFHPVKEFCNFVKGGISSISSRGGPIGGEISFIISGEASVGGGISSITFGRGPDGGEMFSITSGGAECNQTTVIRRLDIKSRS